jgi:hypothetical protein
LENRGFVVLDENNDSAKDGYICFYKKITENYERKVQLDPSSSK